MTGFQVVIQTVIYFFLVATSLAYSERNKRIVNGKQAADVYPHMASIQVKSAGGWHHICGGAVIARNKVLTAAHCVYGKDNSIIRVAVGVIDLYGPPNRYQQTVAVSSYVVHGDYNGKDNDLAVIYLSVQLTLNGGVQIAILAPKDTSFTNTECVITGWGQTDYHRSKATYLLEAKVAVITTTVCKTTFSGHNIGAKNICVYDATGSSGYRISACLGDSGGPLMCGSNFKYLAGILSFGTKTCNGNYPSVYMRVSEFLDWISRN